VIPLIARMRGEINTPVSIDTSQPEVMREAVSVGADMINDVRALQTEGAMEAAAALRVPVCLMHMLGRPSDMQKDPVYTDVVAEVSRFLLSRAHAAQAAGIPASGIVLDPGFGFGKTVQHNVELFRAIPQLCALGFPLLVGLSRKSMLGAITGKPAHERVAASVGAALLAAQSGASILRVHDVGETVDALKTAVVLASFTGH
jgi:dihydropteroate synthase